MRTSEMNANSITKLIKKSEGAGDSKPFLYLQTKWLDTQVTIKLQDSETGRCFQGCVTVEELKKSAEELDVPYNEFYENCRNALTTYLALPGYSYKLDEEENMLQVWQSQDGCIPMLYMEAKLRPLRNHYDLLDEAIEQVQYKTRALSERVEKAHKYDENSRELLEDYRLCVEEKNQLEKKLLRKVAVLINAKKLKISALEERLRQYEDVEGDNSGEDASMDEGSNDAPHSSRKRAVRVVESDSDSDEDDYNANTEPLTLPEANEN